MLSPDIPRRPWLAAALGLLALSSFRFAQQVTHHAPNDAAIVYSDYACGEIGPERARFRRVLADGWVCRQEDMSPGVRATFIAVASHLQLDLEYFYAGLSCGAGPITPASWEFGLIIDGIRRPTGARNPMYPLDQGSTPWIHLGETPNEHRVTLIWPSGADVDLRGLRLRDARTGSNPSLEHPGEPAKPLATIFGDSITHGLGATNVLDTYPSRLGALLGWNVINLGFAGRNTRPRDAWLAAGVGTCTDGSVPPPDLAVLAIGSNDFHLVFNVFTKIDKFESNYRDWIGEFRRLRPTTPLLCVTPVPRRDECSIRKRSLEEYRTRIRSVVESYGDPHIYLFEGRDLIPLPPQSGDPLFAEDGIHMSDFGFQQIAERLSRFNLVRNPSFELLPLEDCLEVPGAPYLWQSAGEGASSVTEDPAGNRILSLSNGGTLEQWITGLSTGDEFVFRGSGLTTSGDGGSTITLEFFDGSEARVGARLVQPFTQDSWRRATRRGTVPNGAVRARLTLSKSSGNGQFLVDDLELTVVDL